MRDLRREVVVAVEIVTVVAVEVEIVTAEAVEIVTAVAVEIITEAETGTAFVEDAEVVDMAVETLVSSAEESCWDYAEFKSKEVSILVLRVEMLTATASISDATATASFSDATATASIGDSFGDGDDLNRRRRRPQKATATAI
ncbi:hypothetical protein R6Q59_034399 [Mikania micrantha]